MTNLHTTAGNVGSAFGIPVALATLALIGLGLVLIAGA